MSGEGRDGESEAKIGVRAGGEAIRSKTVLPRKAHLRSCREGRGRAMQPRLAVHEDVLVLLRHVFRVSGPYCSRFGTASGGEMQLTRFLLCWPCRRPALNTGEVCEDMHARVQRGGVGGAMGTPTATRKARAVAAPTHAGDGAPSLGKADARRSSAATVLRLFPHTCTDTHAYATNDEASGSTSTMPVSTETD